MGGVGRHGVTSNLLGEGKRAMAEQRLRINTTLTSLDLGGEGLFAVSVWDGRGMGGQCEGGRCGDAWGDIWACAGRRPGERETDGQRERNKR